MEEMKLLLKKLDEEIFLKFNELCFYGISEPEMTISYLANLNARISAQISRFSEIVVSEQRAAELSIGAETATCPICMGRGWFGSKDVLIRCFDCKGTGQVR